MIEPSEKDRLLILIIQGCIRDGDILAATVVGRKLRAQNPGLFAELFPTGEVAK